MSTRGRLLLGLWISCAVGCDAATTAPPRQRPTDENPTRLRIVLPVPAIDIDTSLLNVAFAPLTLLTVVNPVDFGAVGDGVTDDSGALLAAMAALPDTGGVVYLPPLRMAKYDVLDITHDHIKWWAPDGRATIVSHVRDGDATTANAQAVRCDHTVGCGFFGVRFESNANARLDTLHDHAIVNDHGQLFEVVGVEVSGSAATGVFAYGTQTAFIEGNGIHHTYADSVHLTEATREVYAWGNQFFNAAPSLGDDGIACVTYGVAQPRCGDMEWWDNVHLGSAWGRGFAVVGGDHIFIHNNFAQDVAGAGILIASEAAYGTAASDHIDVVNNDILGAGAVIAQAGILVSGDNPDAPPLNDLSFSGNVVVDSVVGEAFRTEGNVGSINLGPLSENTADLRHARQPTDQVTVHSTTTLRTRDVAVLPQSAASWAYRIEVRQGTNGFEQRVVYLGIGARVDAEQAALDCEAAGAHTQLLQEPDSDDVVLVTWASGALDRPAGVAALSFAELRSALRTGQRLAVWRLLER